MPDFFKIPSIPFPSLFTPFCKEDESGFFSSARNCIKGFGVAVGLYGAYQATSSLIGKAHKMWTTREGAWIPGDLLGKLTRKQYDDGQALFTECNRIQAEIQAIEEAPINWFKVVIISLLVALACLSMMFGNTTIAGMPALLATIGSTANFQEQKITQARLDKLKKQQHEANAALQSFVAELRKNLAAQQENPKDTLVPGQEKSEASVDGEDLVKEFVANKQTTSDAEKTGRDAETFEGTSLDTIWNEACKSANLPEDQSIPEETKKALESSFNDTVKWNQDPANATNKATVADLIKEFADILTESRTTWAEEFETQQTQIELEKIWTKTNSTEERPSRAAVHRLSAIVNHLAPPQFLSRL